jgi:hypothetical protein
LYFWLPFWAIKNKRLQTNPNHTIDLNSLNDKVFIIKFLDDKAWLVPSKSLSLKAAGLPETVDFFYESAYWKIKVLYHNAQERRIFAEILGYFSGDAAFSDAQLASLASLEQIDTLSYRSIQTFGMLHTIGRIQAKISESPRIVHPQPLIETVEEPLVKMAKEQLLRQVSVQVSVPIKKIKFCHGRVTFEKFFKEVNQDQTISIFNYEVREEFDAIKNYFANVWKSKLINVSVTFFLTNNEVTEVKAFSPEIYRINKELIENVKFEFVRSNLRKGPAFMGDKSLFTMDEFFDGFKENQLKSNVFYGHENELLDDLLQISKTKHYKHLRFLSSLHAHNIMKLRFIHKPLSFIFLITGERKYHIVWETLDTEEATYVWHIDKDLKILKLSLQKIEDILNVIKVQGKTAYINSHEFNAQRIFHDYSEVADGFIKWKSELENYLN